MSDTSADITTDGKRPSVQQRVNVALIPAASVALERLQERRGMKQVDIVNRALQVYEYIDEEICGGNDIVVRTPDGREQIIRFLP